MHARTHAHMITQIVNRVVLVMVELMTCSVPFLLSVCVCGCVGSKTSES